MFKKLLTTSALAGAVLMTSVSASAAPNICNTVSFDQFKTAVDQAYEETLQFGFGLGMWATLVNRVGTVCHVYAVGGEDATAIGGSYVGSQAWLGSRVISAQKANTANAFSLDGLAISTGAISVAVYPGGSLYGLQHSNPVDATRAYAGSANRYGQRNDPLKGRKIGGINVFGGGVAVYGDTKLGAVGVSGDTSCRDHAMAWRVRTNLGLDNNPNSDALALVDVPAALFEQPACGVNDPTGAEFGINP